MTPFVQQHRERIASLCRQHQVRRLDVFGSALDETYDPARSDVDLAVDFAPVRFGEGFDLYMGFKTALEQLLGRPVDLVELKALRNARLKRHIETSMVPLYAAA